MFIISNKYKRCVLSLVLMAVFSSLVWGAIPTQERAALIALYNSTNGDSWTNKSGWKTPPLHTDGFAMPGTEGSWYGVTVQGDHVTILEYLGNHLTGSIPPTIENLTDLQELNLHYNQIGGSIPAELGNMSHMRSIYMEANQLSGRIPSELGNLGNLQRLHLARNQLSGSIPSELANCTNLQHIWLDANQLSGSIPSGLGNLTQLKEFCLFDNQLSGNIPPEIGNWTNLIAMCWSNNQLSGTIPSSLGNLTQLSHLSLNNNRLYGEIPTSLTNLISISEFDIGYNCLQATNPTLRAWLNIHDPDWEAHQNQCGSITVTSPNGGESWVVGSSHSITWTNTGTVGNIKIEYTTNNGSSWSTIISSTANTGSYPWIVPNSVSSQCKIKISEATTGIPSDTSNSTFSILSGSLLTVTSPNGGESWVVGSSHPITWTTTGTVSNVKIQYTTNNGSSWSTIISSTANTGSYPWTVPNSVSSQCQVKISEAATGIPSDTSNSTFSILSGSVLTITSPNGGETWAVGSSHAITWTTTGTVANVKIQYTTNNGSSWSKIISSTANTGSYPWIIPNSVSSQCKIKISDASDGIPSDVSNSTFSILTGLRITITSPNGGERWVVGSSHSITWTTTGTLGNVRIEYTKNNGSSWTRIASYTANDGSYTWTIPTTVSSQCKVKISDVSGGIPADTSDAVFSIIKSSTISLNRTKLNFCSLTSGALTTPQDVWIANSGSGTLKWNISSNALWLICAPEAGIGNGKVVVSVNSAGLTVGTYIGKVTIIDRTATNSPQSVSVTLKVKPDSQDMEPFGEFLTPFNGLTVSSSIPVTGWVLDDVGVQSVKIYREEADAQSESLVFIGDAVLVDGARPDVEAAFPDYPNHYKAGWGYMLLTNFLPNGGNGVFKLHAIVEDMTGNSADLGVKTITVDNAHAVKPFGAIDTPLQGGTASGSRFINWGWVLTPQPNIIPANGSTIHVWVDGIDIGHPVYNNYREDIAAVFPGYANSNGAAGYFYLNTASCENGIHTLSWTATDSGGNTDGIGSRYFAVQNTGTDMGSGEKGRAEARLRQDKPWKRGNTGIYIDYRRIYV